MSSEYAPNLIEIVGQRLQQFCAFTKGQHAHPRGFGVELKEQAPRCGDFRGKDRIATLRAAVCRCSSHR